MSPLSPQPSTAFAIAPSTNLNVQELQVALQGLELGVQVCLGLLDDTHTSRNEPPSFPMKTGDDTVLFRVWFATVRTMATGTSGSSSMGETLSPISSIVA